MKFKKINSDYFITILDRLTRLEPAYIRYNRVFDDIINKFSLVHKAKNLKTDEKIELAVEIFNSSLADTKTTSTIKDILFELENKYFINYDLSEQFLNAPINIEQMINEVEYSDSLPKNVLWLKKLLDNSDRNLVDLRQNEALLYPIEKIILCEGETENTLLKTIFQQFNIDLDKKGYYVLAAGGKNQVARKYYKMIEYIKIPFFILLDKDATQIKTLVQPKLRPQDDIYLIQCGEFEDIFPKNILINAINSFHNNELHCSIDDFLPDFTTVHNLDNIYKKYGFGEYKKALFARKLKEFIELSDYKTEFSSTEAYKIVNAIK